MDLVLKAADLFKRSIESRFVSLPHFLFSLFLFLYWNWL